MANIDYYFVTLSPFTYLAGMKLETIAAKHGASINYKPCALAKVFEQTGGLALADRHVSRQNYRLQELERISRYVNLPINIRPAYWPTNPVPSCSAIISAQTAGGGDVGALVFSLLRASWAEEKDIAEDSVVKACLEANGFDPAILDRDMLNAVGIFERNTQDAIDAGVFGSPSYVVGDQVFWGQDRLDYLDAMLAG